LRVMGRKKKIDTNTWEWYAKNGIF
jgi:hypothetical protein